MENIYAKKKNDFIYVTILNIYINIVWFYFQIQNFIYVRYFIIKKFE